MIIDTRMVGQELQHQVLSAARKGRERVASTVKTVTTTAQHMQHMRPQLHNLPRPDLSKASLLTPAQLREKAPALIAMLPKPEQLRAGAHEVAGHARSVQRLVLGQVRGVTTPLTHQAAARLAKVGIRPAPPRPRHTEATTRVSEVQVSHAAPTHHAPTHHAPAAHHEGAHSAGHAASSGKAKAKPKAPTK